MGGFPVATRFLPTERRHRFCHYQGRRWRAGFVVDIELSVGAFIGDVMLAGSEPSSVYA